MTPQDRELVRNATSPYFRVQPAAPRRQRSAEAQAALDADMQRMRERAAARVLKRKETVEQ